MIATNLKKRIYTSIFLFLLIFLMFNFNVILVYSLIILGVLSILEFSTLMKIIFKNKFYLFISNVFIIIYISLFCLIFFFFSNILEFKAILISLLFCCIASDLGGFIFGKIFKGPKLTKISPNKTVSGSFGSIFLACVVMSLLIFYFTKSFSIMIVVTSALTSISCQIGDLVFSFFKRKAKVKDTGNFLPGHGGVLDRLDGIFLGIPFGFIFLTLLY